MSILKILLAVVLGIYILMVLALCFLQENIIFLAEPLEKQYQYAFNVPFEEVNVTMEDGAVINALHLRSKEPKGIIYYHHGNAGNLARWGNIAEYFLKYQYDVFIYDYRGYGKSSGKRSESAMHQDAQVMYDKLKQDWSENQIILFGRSMGSGMACKLAANNHPKMLILETPFYSLKSMARYRFPFLPTNWLVRYSMPNAENLKQTQLPIHIFHGSDDGVVPIWSGRELYEVVQDHAAFTEINGGRHNNLIEYEAYRKGMEAILK